MIGSWKQPVIVFAGISGHIRWTVSDAVRAAEILLEHWPTKEPKPKHLKARRAILRCLEGKCEPEMARQAFIEAAREAGILGT